MSILAGIAAQAKAQEGQIREIPLESIEANAGNFYGIEEEGVAELAASILAVGQRQPIEVYPIPGGLYRIITGERRWRAMKLNRDSGQTDRDTIQAIVRECPMDEAEEVVQIVTTNQYRDKTDFDKLQEVMAVTKAVKGMKEKGVTGWHGIDLERVTVKQAVTAITGMSRTNVSKYGTIGEKLIPELVVWVRNEMLPFTVAYSVCQLPAEWQRRLLVECNGKGKITLDDYNWVLMEWKKAEAEKERGRRSVQVEQTADHREDSSTALGMTEGWEEQCTNTETRSGQDCPVGVSAATQSRSDAEAVCLEDDRTRSEPVQVEQEEKGREPVGWVKVASSAGPWPERDGLCAVKTEHRGLNGYEVFWWNNRGKQWCFPEQVDGEWISVSTRVEMWCALPGVPE